MKQKKLAEEELKRKLAMAKKMKEIAEREVQAAVKNPGKWTTSTIEKAAKYGVAEVKATALRTIEMIKNLNPSDIAGVLRCKCHAKKCIAKVKAAKLQKKSTCP